MIRAFVAVDLSAAVRGSIAEAQARLKQSRAKVAWTKVENLHLTLQFLGRISESRFAQIGETLAAVVGRHSAFDVTVAGAGVFPDERNPRVLWLGCNDAGGKLSALALNVRQSLSGLGFIPDAHEFVAHLTLGRLKTPRPDAALTQALDSIKKDTFGTLRVATIHLYQSQLHPDGSVYTKLSSHALKGDS